MINRIKKVYNVKLLYRWRAPQWFTMIFCLLAIAVPVVAFFMPYFQYVRPGIEAPDIISGKDIVFYLFQQPSANINYLVNDIFVKTLKPEAIGQMMPYAMYIFGALFILVAVFAIFLLVCFFRLLITGALKMWNAPKGLGIASFVGNLMLFAFPLAISLFYNMSSTGVADIPTFNFMWPIIFIGVSFVCMLSLVIIYAAGFKGKEFIPNEMYLDNYIAMMTGEERKQYYPNGIVTIPPQEEPSTTEKQPGYLKKKDEKKPEVATKGVVVDKQPQAAAPVPVVVNVTAPETKENVVTKTITTYKVDSLKVLPVGIKDIGGHAYAQNTTLEIAAIPNNITSIGNSAFANCVALKIVELPISVTKIGYNAFFHCPKLTRINYAGTMKDWKKVKRGSNWLASSGTTIVVCNDGALSVNPYK